MIKSIPVLFLAILLTLVGCEDRKTSKTPIISAEITGLTSDVAYVMPTFDNSFILDTLNIVDKKLTFNYVPDTATLVTLFCNGMKDQISLYIDMNSAIVLKGSFDSLQIENDSINRSWIAFHNKTQNYKDSLAKLDQIIRDAYQKDTMDLFFETINSPEIAMIDSLWGNDLSGYIHDNRDNPTTLLAIQEYLVATQNSDSIVTWMNQMGKSTQGFELDKQLRKIARMRSITQVGSRMPYLKFTDEKGELKNTEQFKDSLLCLYFYMNDDRFTKTVKKDFDGFKKKLKKKQKVEMWAVSLANSEELWKEIVKQDSSKVTNLYASEGVFTKQFKDAGIGSFPLLIVINNKSDIISYNQYGKKLEDTILDYFSK